VTKQGLTYEIKDTIAVLNDNGGITIECNLISFNDAPAKIDIRKWDRRDPDNPKMWKGVSLSKEETELLIGALQDWLIDQTI